jgi:hypothetical protein
MLEVFLISYFLPLFFGIWLKLNTKFMTFVVYLTRLRAFDKGIYLEDKYIVAGAHQALVIMMFIPILNYLVFWEYFRFKVLTKRFKNDLIKG